MSRRWRETKSVSRNYYQNCEALRLILEFIRRLSPRLTAVEIQHGNRRVSRVVDDQRLGLNGVHAMLTTHSLFQQVMLHSDAGPDAESDAVEEAESSTLAKGTCCIDGKTSIFLPKMVPF